MHTEWINISNNDGEYGAYLALPPLGHGPGLILFQEVFGVNKHIRQVAEQYAMDGFVVLAPDVFWREAPRVELGYDSDDLAQAKELKAAMTDEQIRLDAASTLAALRARPEQKGKVGVFGYCFGGRVAYQTAASTDIDAAVCYYGAGTENYLNLAPRIECPVVFQLGGKDPSIPMKVVDQIKRSFEHKPGEVYVYPEAGHGFNCWARSAYHHPSATLAHARSLEWFARTLCEAR
jgi:carboxymethylenebutenolidase